MRPFRRASALVVLALLTFLVAAGVVFGRARSVEPDPRLDTVAIAVPPIDPTTTTIVGPPVGKLTNPPAEPKVTEPPPTAPTTAAPTTSVRRRATSTIVEAPPDAATATATTVPPRAAETDPAADASTARCIVGLHGKGGRGSATTIDAAGITRVAPIGNRDGWGGRQWVYDTESAYTEARLIVEDAVVSERCGAVVLYGFSNGAAFAAKLLCRGETFGGRLRGVVIDDPVVDHAVEGCRRSVGIRVVLYWTGALEGIAQPGWNCAEQDWTCEGGSTIGIGSYEVALGVTRTQSPNRSHMPYDNAPQLIAWL